MPLRRKRARNTDTIVISSSSDTSEASEDSAPESDPDSPSKYRGVAAKNDMSERQTNKLNSGNFGMFNHPTLMPATPPRTPDSGTKRKRVREYNTYQKAPRSRRRREPEVMVREVVEVDDEAEESLFVPERTAESETIIVDDEIDYEQTVYSGMTSERAARAKEYLDTLSVVEAADKRLRAVEKELSTSTKEDTDLLWKLATIDATADERIADIFAQRDEAIRLANELAEEKIKKVRERLPVKKGSYQDRLRDVAGQREGLEGRVAEAKAELEGLQERKDQLQRLGGFELCGDVRDVQERRRR